MSDTEISREELERVYQLYERTKEERRMRNRERYKNDPEYRAKRIENALIQAQKRKEKQTLDPNRRKPGRPRKEESEGKN